ARPTVKRPTNLAAVYSRVEDNTSRVNQRFPAVVRDLTTNGPFITGEALPLLTRVTIHFEAKGVGPIDAIGWVMWRRDEDCPGTGRRGHSTPKKRRDGHI